MQFENIIQSLQSLQAAGFNLTQAYLMIPLGLGPISAEPPFQLTSQEIGLAELNPVETAKLGRLIQALEKVPLNDTRAVVLRLLAATKEGEWLSFQTMVAEFEAEDIAKGKAAIERGAAALRDLSWQIKYHMPETDLVGTNVAIDVLAIRRRLGKETRYQLTKLGRAALKHIGVSA
jgi:hypothetical protein